MAQPQNSNSDWRNQEIVIDPFVYQLAAGVFLIIVATLIGFALFPDDKGYLTNLYTTGIGVLITVAYLDRRAERREARAAETDLKAKLIREMGSQVNEVAIHAVEELKANKWLETGLLANKVFTDANLHGARLDGANLERSDLQRSVLNKANLSTANLQDAKLRFARLQECEMWFSNLQGAFLNGADLIETQLVEANLQNASLKDTNLEKAVLTEAILYSTSFAGANLKNAILHHAHFNESTILPDGTLWTATTDIRRFTDPNHPQFWRSDDPGSPAYRGNTSR